MKNAMQLKAVKNIALNFKSILLNIYDIMV